MFRPIHFEIPVADAERAIKFYSTVFQWKFSKWEGGEMQYWMVMTGEGPGIDGGLMIRPGGGQGGVVNTIDVPALDDHIALALANGATLAVPKMAIPGVGWLAYCADPDGNIFGMMQNDPGAK